MTNDVINKVLYDVDQTADTTAAEKATARANIGAAAAVDVPSITTTTEGPEETVVVPVGHLDFNLDDLSVNAGSSPIGTLVPRTTPSEQRVLTLDANDPVPYWAVASGVGSDELFIATYNSTTYQQVSDALTAGKAVFLKYGNAFIPLSSSTATRHGFLRYTRQAHSYAAQSDSVVAYVLQNDDTWSTNTTSSSMNVNAGDYMTWSVANDTLTLDCTMPPVTRYQSGGALGPVYADVAFRLGSSNQILAKSTDDADYVCHGFDAPVTTNTGDNGKFLKVTTDGLNTSVSWDSVPTGATYSAGRNMWLNQDNSFQTNLPGGLFAAPTSADNLFHRIAGATFAGAYQLVCKRTTSDTYEIAIAFTSSGTTSTYQFIGTETVIATDNTVTTKGAVYNETCYYTPSVRFGYGSSTIFNPANHKAIIYNGIGLIGPCSDCKIAIWNDNGSVNLLFTAIEVGKVGST